MKKIINYSVRRKMTKMNRESFVVPYLVENLHIGIEFSDDISCIGYIILRDAAGTIRLQKLLGHGEQNICISKSSENTTIGGVPGKLPIGEWELYLGIFTEYIEQKLDDEEFTIGITITDEEIPVTESMGKICWVDGKSGLEINNYDWNKVFSLEKRWYKGDFHTHTTLSDGKETVKGAMEKAKMMNLDFYVPTEHNLMHTGWCDTDTMIVPGIEITTDKGHFNLFGINKMPENLLEIVSRNGEDVVDDYVDEVMKKAHEHRWIVSINHPFLTIWSWRYEHTRLSDIDCLEIINDPTYTDAKESNDKAIRFLDALWNNGNIIYGIGGSDSHNLLEERYEGAALPSIAGDPATYVYCNTFTPHKLIKHLKMGNVCVTRYCKIHPFIKVGDMEYLPGSRLEIHGEQLMTYSLDIQEMEGLPKVYLVINGDYKEIEVTKQEEIYTAKANITIKEGKWQWMRMEVRSQSGLIKGFVNPVYCGNKDQEYKTFGELMAAIQ